MLIVTSILIFIIAQISPYENKKKFTFFNTMWYTIGYLLRYYTFEIREKTFLKIRWSIF
jgi:hypothetical protein